MTSDAPSDILVYFPTELLMKIFTYLPGKDLVKCREVCVRWNDIVTDICISNTLWHNYCKAEFREIYQIAKLKARPQLQWFQIYKSLSLWPKLGLAREITDGFASASHLDDQIRNFTILPNGVLGVHKQNEITYYDMETMKSTQQEPIIGHYLRYAENEELIVTLTYNLQLQIIIKAQNENHEISSAIDNVKYFLLVRSDVYYVALNDEIGVSVSIGEGGLLRKRIITHVADGVMTLGFTSSLNVLTYRRHICSLVGDELVEVCCLDKSTNPLDQLRHYNFLEHLDWRIYFQWMYILNQNIPSGPIGDIVTIRAYGDVVFVGSNRGVLRIYHAPYCAGKFDIHRTKPIKQYSFIPSDAPVLSMCPIIQVDVVEAEDGHRVFVATPKKIVVINYFY